jgi:hypothetical protein
MKSDLDQIKAEALEVVKAEAAVKLVPIQSKDPSREPIKGPVDGDGDEPGEPEVESFFIEIALNGFVLTVNLDDGLQEKTVHTDFNELLSSIRSRY